MPPRSPCEALAVMQGVERVAQTPLRAWARPIGHARHPAAWESALPQIVCSDPWGKVPPVGVRGAAGSGVRLWGSRSRSGRCATDGLERRGVKARQTAGVVGAQAGGRWRGDRFLTVTPRLGRAAPWEWGGCQVRTRWRVRRVLGARGDGGHGGSGGWHGGGSGGDSDPGGGL